MVFFTLILSQLLFPAYGIEVIKPDYSDKKIYLNIIRVVPDSFETYTLTNSNLREMQLVCAENRVYENNKLAFIEYRNFYDEKAARFTISHNSVCKDLARFIEQAHFAVTEEKPIKFILSRKTMEVATLIYPDIDPLADDGDVNDLLPKKNFRIILGDSERLEINTEKN